MSVTDALDAMRSEIPGCSLVAFADLNSQLVLSASSLGQPGQEELDALSNAAQLVLNGTVAEGAATVWTDTHPDAAAETAMLLTEAEARVFLRAPGGAPEALICLCAPESDLELVLDKGRATLARIQVDSQ